MVKAYAAANIMLPTVRSFEGDGDKQHVGTSEQRKNENGSNVKDSSQIRKRKECNKLKH